MYVAFTLFATASANATLLSILLASSPSTFERQNDDDAYEEVTLDLTGAFSQKIPVRLLLFKERAAVGY